MFEGLTDLSVTTRDIKVYHQNIATRVTPKISSYLNIKVMEVPDVLVEYNNDVPQAACVENGNVVLRPLIHHGYEGTYEIPVRFTIHEIAHIALDNLLGLSDKSETDVPVFLSEGFADYLSIDDPAKIYDGTSIVYDDGEPADVYDRVRSEITKGRIWGKTLASYFSLGNLFATHQMDLKEKPLSEEKEAKAIAPNIIGASLVRFIVEKEGLESLKDIMRQVQVDKKYAYGWSMAKSADNVSLEAEEQRVNSLLKKAIVDKFGDVVAFEKEWKEKVLGKELLEPTPINDYDKLAESGLYDGMMKMYAEKDDHFNDDILLYDFFANPKGQYLEVDCGTGRILMPLLKKGHIMTGVDTSGSMLQVAEQKQKNI